MLRKISSSEYARNSFILIFGTGLAQLIPILLQPILRRLFTDEEFGIFAQFYSIVSVLSIVSNLRYSNSIVIPKSDKEALGILAGSLLLNFITSLVFFLLFILFGQYLFSAIGFSSELVNYIWMLPVSIFLIATNISFNFWLTRKKKYIGMAVNKGVRRISEGGMQMALSNGFQKGGLIIGSLIGDFLNLLMFLFQFKKAEGSFKGVDKTTIKNALAAQSEFPKHSLFPALLDVVSMNLPIFIISSN
jgi:O-antigen/teichoic acid export membrane protein